MQILKQWAWESLLIQKNNITKNIIDWIKDWTIKLLDRPPNKFIINGLELSYSIQRDINALIRICEDNSESKENFIKQVEQKITTLLKKSSISLLSTFNTKLLLLLDEFNSWNTEKYELIERIFSLNTTMFLFLKENDENWIIDLRDFNETFSEINEELKLFIAKESDTKQLSSSLLKLQTKIGFSEKENDNNSVEAKKDDNYLNETLDLASSINLILEQLEKDTKETLEFREDVIDQIIERFTFIEDWWRKNKQEALAKLNSYFLELFTTIKELKSILYWSDLIKLNSYNIEVLKSLKNKWKIPFLHESKTRDTLIEINNLTHALKQWDIIWSDTATHWYWKDIDEMMENLKNPASPKAVP